MPPTRRRPLPETNANAVKATALEGRAYAERFVLTSVGGVLVYRDTVQELFQDIVKRYGSVATAQKEVTRDLKKFERRGVTARNRLERDVRKARTRVERELRTRRRAVERTVKTNRRRVEREVTSLRKDVTKRANEVTDQVKSLV